MKVADHNINTFQKKKIKRCYPKICVASHCLKHLNKESMKHYKMYVLDYCDVCIKIFFNKHDWKDILLIQLRKIFIVRMEKYIYPIQTTFAISNIFYCLNMEFIS